jgi:hypothetical protein
MQGRYYVFRVSSIDFADGTADGTAEVSKQFKEKHVSLHEYFIDRGHDFSDICVNTAVIRHYLVWIP